MRSESSFLLSLDHVWLEVFIDIRSEFPKKKILKEIVNDASQDECLFDSAKCQITRQARPKLRSTRQESDQILSSFKSNKNWGLIWMRLFRKGPSNFQGKLCWIGKRSNKHRKCLRTLNMSNLLENVKLKSNCKQPLCKCPPETLWFVFLFIFSVRESVRAIPNTFWDNYSSLIINLERES